MSVVQDLNLYQFMFKTQIIHRTLTADLDIHIVVHFNRILFTFSYMR